MIVLMLRTGTMHSRRFVAYPLLFRTGTALTTLRTLATLRTGTALATLRTLATLTAGRTLHIALWLRNEHTVRELVLARLRINLKELHGDLVALLDASLFNSL
jgi:hypothetical protein